MDRYFKSEPMDVQDDEYWDDCAYRDQPVQSKRSEKLFLALKRRDLVNKEINKLRSQKKSCPRKTNLLFSTPYSRKPTTAAALSIKTEPNTRTREPFGVSSASRFRCNNSDRMSQMFWEEAVKDAIRGSWKGHESLVMALKKREVASKQIKRLQDYILRQSHKNKNFPEFLKSKCGKKRKPSPFIRFYVKVYRELCGKYSIKEIAKEAARRWRCMSPAEKARYGQKRRKC